MIYPAHFGGAAFGKGLSGKPGSTIGFERRFNPALQLTARPQVVRFVLEDLPSPMGETLYRPSGALLAVAEGRQFINRSRS
jgi:hypothetical protein